MTRLAALFLAQFARPADVPPPVRYVADDGGLLRRTDADRPDPDIVRGAHGRSVRLAAGLGTWRQGWGAWRQGWAPISWPSRPIPMSSGSPPRAGDEAGRRRRP